VRHAQKGETGEAEKIRDNKLKKYYKRGNKIPKKYLKIILI
jgi:hypothetical protein